MYRQNYVFCRVRSVTSFRGHFHRGMDGSHVGWWTWEIVLRFKRTRIDQESSIYSIPISTESKVLTVKFPTLCFLWWAGRSARVSVQAKSKWISTFKKCSLTCMGFWSSREHMALFSEWSTCVLVASSQVGCQISWRKKLPVDCIYSRKEWFLVSFQFF